LLWRFGLRSVIFLPRFYIAPLAWRVRTRIFHVSHRLQPILQPCPLWPFPFLERLVDAVLSGKINHPRFAQPKLALEHFERVEQFRYGRPVKYPFHILNLDNRDTDNVLFLKDVRNRIDQLIEFLSTHSSPSSLFVMFP
jgi:hypothetical protein